MHPPPLKETLTYGSFISPSSYTLRLGDSTAIIITIINCDTIVIVNIL